MAGSSFTFFMIALQFKVAEASDEEGGESDDSGSVFEVDSEDLLSESSEEYSTDYSEANEEGDESDSEVDEDEEDEDDSDYDD
ncbi:hypothetical protein HMI54_006220 [Coelomomyces lativittatus]|nr:hypothetical protein HMI54_006220 [Coelomomyces lativittatus]